MQCPESQLSAEVLKKIEEYKNSVSNDNPIKAVSCMNPAYPSGNTTVFFGCRMNDGYDGKYQDLATMEITDYLSSVIMNHFCTVASGQGRSAAITTSPQPPAFFLVKGRTLFDTICASLSPIGENDVPMWRREKYSWNVLDCKDDGWLSFVFYPVRYIMPVTVDKETFTVSKVLFAGIKFPDDDKKKSTAKVKKTIEEPLLHPKHAIDIWVKSSPFIAKKTTKAGTRPVIIRADDAFWTAIPDFYTITEKGIMQNAPVICSANVIEMLGYTPILSMYCCTLGTQSEKMPVEAKFDNCMPFEMWRFNNQKKRIVLDYIDFAKDVYKALSRALYTKDKELTNKTSADEAVFMLKDEVRQFLFKIYIPAVARISNEELDEYKNDLIRDAYRKAALRAKDLLKLYAPKSKIIEMYEAMNQMVMEINQSAEKHNMPDLWKKKELRSAVQR